MAESVRVVAYEGGELRYLSGSDGNGEAVLGLPMSRLLVKMIRVPNEAKDDPSAFAAETLKAMSPYPDDELSVSCETVCEDARGLVVIAAAFPESSGDDIAEALDAKKLNVTRIDVLELGALRGLWSQLTEGDVRRLVLLQGPDGIGIVVLDGQLPTALRAIRSEADLKRETMLSLLEAEDFGGPKPLAEIVVAVARRGEDAASTGQQDVDAASSPRRHTIDLDVLSSFAPVRTLEIGEDAALVGVAERTAEAGALNALPASWREVLDETRFKAKLSRFIAVSVGIWVLAMGVLFGVPYGYGYFTGRQKQMCKDHRKQYMEVKDMRAKVNLVRKYSDHTRGALEIMKAVSDRLPGDIVLGSWTYKREDGVRISGEADEAKSVWEMEDKARAIAGEGEDEKVFPTVKLTGPTATRGNKQKFDLELSYEKKEEE